MGEAGLSVASVLDLAEVLDAHLIVRAALGSWDVNVEARATDGTRSSRQAGRG